MCKVKNMKNTGKEYEVFVQKLQQALLDSEEYSKQKNIVVERNKKLIDNSGIEREFDLYWEYELGGILYKTIIECKDYNSKVSVDKIDSIIGKIRDLPDIKPIFATKIGYQNGAEKKAKQNKIDLLIVREQQEDDWKDKDGNSFIKKVHVKLVSLPAPEIIDIQTYIDENWIKENTNLDIENLKTFTGMNNEIFICDENKNETYSFLEVSKIISDNDKKIDKNTYIHIEEYENAFICYDNIKLKLRALKFDYILLEPVQNQIEVDYSKELIGVIEYVNHNKRTAVFKHKVVKDWK